MRRFFEYTELRTKVTSIIVFFMTVSWLVGRGIPIRIWPTAVFFVSMLLFDLATTAINNFIDTKTNGENLPYERDTARNIIFALLALAMFLGLLLVWMTNWIVLFLGTLCFACGILYTYGPVAISRIPLGEIFSGFFYGIMIPLILAVIQTESVLSVSMDGAIWSIRMNVRELFMLGLFGLVPALTTANIMLANNICDLQKDIVNGRFTIAYYLKEGALRLFARMYRACYVAVLLMIALKILPWTTLSVLLSYPPVEKNIRCFCENQSKKETFILSIKNYLLINLTLTLGLILNIFLR